MATGNSLGDIEDLFGGSTKQADPFEEQKQKVAAKGGKVTRKIIRKRPPIKKKAQDQEEEGCCVPGTEKVFVKTYGCSHNISDSEFMMGLLNEYGYQLVDDVESCDCAVINSCTVKNPSQDAFMFLVNKAKDLKKPVIVSGCVPQGDRNLKGLEDVSILGVT